VEQLVAPRTGTGRARVLTAVGFALVVFLLSWYRHASYHSSTLDLGVYDQAVWKLAHFRAPALSTIGWDAFADHLSLVLFAFVPCYWVAASPLWLLGAQAVALGLGFLALGPALDALGVGRRWRFAFSVAYLASPLLWNAALYDFHPTTLAVPILLVGLRAAALDHRRALVLSMAGLLVLRDDLALAVVAMALFGYTGLSKERRRLRLALIALPLGWMLGAGLLAAVLGSDRHWAFHYGYLAATPSGAVLHPVHTLIRLLPGLWRADNAGLVLLGLLLPLGLLPAFAPRRLALVAIPSLPLLASSHSQFHSVRFHYDAFLFPFLLMAAATGVARTGRSPAIFRNPLLAITATLALLMAAGPWGQLGGRAGSPSDYRRAFALVGPEEHVMATDEAGAHLAHRDVLLLFPFALAHAVPDFPLPARVAVTTPETAANVDVIVVGPVRFPAQQAVAYEAFLRSSYLADFPSVRHFGPVTVYRRTPPPDSSSGPSPSFRAARNSSRGIVAASRYSTARSRKPSGGAGSSIRSMSSPRSAMAFT
jgi:uncharacterized membrane protein